MYLYHYFDKATGPFQNLSDISVEQAKSVLEAIKIARPSSQAAQRHDKYVEYRRNCEKVQSERVCITKRKHMRIAR